MKKAIILLFFILLLIPAASGSNNTLPTWEELDELGAFDPVNNLQANASAISNSINVSDNYLFQTLEWDNESSEYENTLRIITFPITFGASDQFIGSWFYVFLIVVVLIMVYGKSKSLEVTTSIMLIISLVVVLANSGGALALPASFMTFIYIMGILGLFGVLRMMFGE